MELERLRTHKEQSELCPQDPTSRITCQVSFECAIRIEINEEVTIWVGLKKKR